MPRSPDPVNTWYHSVNNTVSEADDLTMRAELLYQLKERFLGNGTWTDRAGGSVSPSFGWSVDYSCDSSTAGAANDGVDRWVDNGDLVWGTDGSDNYSWMVLVHDDFFGAGLPLYVLLVCTESNTATRNGTLAIFLSEAGFTGGTISARPTAADEHQVLAMNGTGSSNSSGWQGEDSTGILAKRFHAQITDDGTKVRFFITEGGNTEAVWDLFHVDDADSNWDRPVLMMVMSEDSNEEHNTWLNSYNSVAQGGRYHGYDSVQGAFICQLGMYGYTSAETAHTAHAVSTFGSRVMPVPIPVRGDGSPVVGPLCYVPDAWWVNGSNGTGDAGTDDEANTFAFAQFGDWMVDWNRTDPLVS
jgi:hypothetical protein